MSYKPCKNSVFELLMCGEPRAGVEGVRNEPYRDVVMRSAGQDDGMPRTYFMVILAVN